MTIFEKIKYYITYIYVFDCDTELNNSTLCIQLVVYCFSRY